MPAASEDTARRRQFIGHGLIATLASDADNLFLILSAKAQLEAVPYPRGLPPMGRDPFRIVRGPV